ncbi:MAG: hypothetical protein LBF59_01445, partial [Prevotellaceae bacterium]|nr:hypothetical protein [Prevotellaceae bacterium]
MKSLIKSFTALCKGAILNKSTPSTTTALSVVETQYIASPPRLSPRRHRRHSDAKYCVSTRTSRRTRRTFSSLLALICTAFALAMFPATAFADETSSLSIGGVEVVSDLG